MPREENPNAERALTNLENHDEVETGIAKGKSEFRIPKLPRCAGRGPDTNDLAGSADYRHDAIHFGPRGLQAHAERWYVALSSHYQLANPVSGKAK